MALTRALRGEMSSPSAKMWRVAWAICAVAASVGAAAQDQYLFAQDPRRFALVIGNRTYENLSELPSASADAIAVGKGLRELGFDVTMRDSLPSVRDFEDDLLPNFRKKLNEGDLVVFYYSGHGFSYGQSNYIAPADLPRSVTPGEVAQRAIAIENVEEYLSKRTPGVLLLVIDACRTIAGFVVAIPGQSNLVAKGVQPVAQRIGVASSTILAFAARPGTIALGSSNANDLSIFTASLVKRVPTEAMEFSPMFSEVSTDVRLATSDDQQPGLLNWSTSDLFMKQTDLLVAQEREAWLAALGSGQRADVSRYLRRHAVSRYAAAARKWLLDHPQTAETLAPSPISPLAVERAWTSTFDSPIKAVLPSLSGFGYLARASQARTGSLSDPTLGVVGLDKALPMSNTSAAKLTDQLQSYAAHGKILAASALVARASPFDGAGVVGVVKPGTELQVDDVIRRSTNGSSWIGIRLPETGASAFLPVPTSAPSIPVRLGVNMLELVAPPVSVGLTDLVEGSVVQQAALSLKARQKTVRWVSLATAPALDERTRLQRQARLTHASYLLQKQGIDARRITGVSDAADMTGDGVRIRFFGE